MTRQIQVANLPDSVNAVVLRELFEGYGSVRSATVNTHFQTGRSTGVGFVQMTSKHDGTAAIAALNQRERFGQLLSASWCNSSINRVPALSADAPSSSE
jgi:RNA recognition motif-containing protein